MGREHRDQGAQCVIVIRVTATHTYSRKPDCDMPVDFQLILLKANLGHFNGI